MAGDSVPEPDIVVSRYDGDRFMPADTVALVVEVSDTTLSTDLGRKAELYAAAGLPEYWVVDVQGRRIIQFSQPRTGSYEERSVVSSGEQLAARSISGLKLRTDDLFV